MGVAQDNLNTVTEAQQASYDDNFKQQLDDFAQSALNDSTLIDRAAFDAKLATETATGINTRARSRAGVALSGQAANHAARLGDIQASKFTANANNRAVVAQDARNTDVLTDSLNAYNDLGKAGMDALKDAAGLEAAREAENQRRKAQAKSSLFGSIAQLGSMAIYAGV
jgi:hypothetical protein